MAPPLRVDFPPVGGASSLYYATRAMCVNERREQRNGRGRL